MSDTAPPDRSKPPQLSVVPQIGNDRIETRPRPIPLSSFVGREREVTRVAELLQAEDVRILTLTGPGGIGKTRLAHRIIEHLEDTYAAGAVFVPLAAARDPKLVFASVGNAIGVPDTPGTPIEVRIQALIANRHFLLVLDNFEHVLDAAPQLVELLERCPRLQILCTSRIRLGISGEHIFIVPSMAVPDVATGSSIAEVARIDSVRLFVQRGIAQSSNFALTSENAKAIADICRRLDGVPLAIELAAARVAVLPPAMLLSRLTSQLNLLVDGPRDAPARLQSMREAIAWSYELLSESDRECFRNLGVFIGGFTLEAAEAVAGSNLLKSISTLVSSSLVNMAIDKEDAPRFIMLETIREFALEQLVVTSEEFPVHQAHAKFYCQLAESAIPLYDGPEMPQNHVRLYPERDNCRAAMRWSLDNGDAETAVRLAGALWRDWYAGHTEGQKSYHDAVQEGRNWIEQALAVSRDLPAEAVAEALTGASAFCRLQDDRETAVLYAEELLHRSRTEQYSYGMYWALYTLGQLVTASEFNLTYEFDDPSLSYDLPNQELGRRLFQQALDLAPSVRNSENHAAMALGHLALLNHRAGALDDAANDLSRAVELSRKTGNPYILAYELTQYAQVLRNQHYYRSAVNILHEAATSFANQSQMNGVHAVLIELALIASRLGQTERMIRFVAAAEPLPSNVRYQECRDRLVTKASEKLGQAAFSSIWDANRHVRLEEVFDEFDEFENSIEDLQSAPPAESHRGLSPREFDVLRMLADGQSNREIAASLSLSERTVENHVLHILTKLDLGSRTAAAIYAVRHGLA